MQFSNSDLSITPVSMAPSNCSVTKIIPEAMVDLLPIPVQPDIYPYSETSTLANEKQASATTGMHDDIETIREREFERMKGQVYLDHAGTAIVASSVLHAVFQDQMRNLYGNPHSESTPSMLSTQKMERVRDQVLRFFNADPKHWDLVFVANSTAAIKLVADCFADYSKATKSKLWYGYYKDAHTSLVGARQLARKHHCFTNDEEVDQWIRQGCIGKNRKSGDVGLFAYPGQSNMTGRRLPLQWCADVKNASAKEQTYVLLDAAALATTTTISLDDLSASPDFVALSFYKIFGWIEIGGLLVRKSCSHIIEKRRYFGGGTVDMVMAVGKTWHAKKESSIHEQLEEGTPAFNTIIALGHAMDVHEKLYGPDAMASISRRTTALIKLFYDGLNDLHHSNGYPLVKIYKDEIAEYGDPTTQGATISMNIMLANGSIVNDLDIIKKANASNICLRGGSHCNPGGFAMHLGWSDEDMQAAYDAGHRCSNPLRGILGKPTGTVRVSLGASSMMSDVTAMIQFLRTTYLDAELDPKLTLVHEQETSSSMSDNLQPAAYAGKRWYHTLQKLFNKLSCL